MYREMCIRDSITELEGHFTELQQQRQAEQEQGDTFSIYQLKRGDEPRDLRFEPYDRLQAAQQFVKIFHLGNESIYRRFQLCFCLLYTSRCV